MSEGKMILRIGNFRSNDVLFFIGERGEEIVTSPVQSAAMRFASVEEARERTRMLLGRSPLVERMRPVRLVGVRTLRRMRPEAP